MTIEFGDVLFNVRNMKVAPLLASGAYGGAVVLDYGNTMSFAVESDTDELMSYGMAVERLSIPVRVTGTFQQGAYNAIALWILTGMVTTSSGTTPNQIADTEILGGGSGLPYFGLIGDFAATNGASGLVLLRKVQLDAIPEWKVEQNKFRLSEVSFTGMAIDTTGRKMIKIRRNETAAAIPDFNQFAA